MGRKIQNKRNIYKNKRIAHIGEQDSCKVVSGSAKKTAKLYRIVKGSFIHLWMCFLILNYCLKSWNCWCSSLTCLDHDFSSAFCPPH